MALGLGVLGLAPQTFWSMTPKELEAAIRGRLGSFGSTTPPSRAEFVRLIDRYPDGAVPAGSAQS